MAGFDLLEHVEAARSDSATAAASFRGSIRLLFVDGDHEYEGVSRDLLAWSAHVGEGGVIVLHDVGEWEGPTRVACELLAQGYVRLGQSGTALALVRCGRG